MGFVVPKPVKLRYWCFVFLVEMVFGLGYACMDYEQGGS